MDHIRYQKWGSSLSKFFERSFYIWFINFRLPEKAMVEIKPSAVNRSTNSDILIYNRVDQLKIQFQQVHCRYQNVAQVQWKGCWETSVDRTTSRFTFHQTSGGISSAFVLFPTKKTFYSQVLSPTEEEVLVKQVTKMGENGPVIFDRHFFTLVRKYNTLPKSDCWLIHPGDWQTPWAQLWMDQLCQGASRLVTLITTYLQEQSFNREFYIRCLCSTSWGNLQDGLQRRIGLPRFDSKARQGVWLSLILQSWFNKSLDACVLRGDKECQVSEISFGSLLILL